LFSSVTKLGIIIQYTVNKLCVFLFFLLLNLLRISFFLLAPNYQTGEYLPACVGFVRGLLAAGLRQLTV
jgi:hypothetical protein